MSERTWERTVKTKGPIAKQVFGPAFLLRIIVIFPGITARLFFLITGKLELLLPSRYKRIVCRVIPMFCVLGFNCNSRADGRLARSMVVTSELVGIQRCLCQWFHKMQVDVKYALTCTSTCLHSKCCDQGVILSAKICRSCNSEPLLLLFVSIVT